MIEQECGEVSVVHENVVTESLESVVAERQVSDVRHLGEHRGRALADAIAGQAQVLQLRESSCNVARSSVIRVRCHVNHEYQAIQALP